LSCKIDWLFFFDFLTGGLADLMIALLSSFIEAVSGSGSGPTLCVGDLRAFF
jgi:hypothetical protein